MSEEIPGQTSWNEDQAVTQQPQSISGPSGNASGMEELAKTDKIVVQQMVDMTEACCCYEGETMIKNFIFDQIHTL